MHLIPTGLLLRRQSIDELYHSCGVVLSSTWNPVSPFTFFQSNEPGLYMAQTTTDRQAYGRNQHKLWIATGKSAGVFGEGKYQLLQGIADTGSLSASAEQLGISYRKAWGDIKKAEARLKKKLINRARGGKGGGASTLTPFAEQLLQEYAAFKKDVEEYTEKRFNRMKGFKS